MDHINIYRKHLYYGVPEGYETVFSKFDKNQKDGSSYFYIADNIKKFYALFGEKHGYTYLITTDFKLTIKDKIEDYKDKYDKVYVKVYDVNNVENGKEI